MVAPFQCKMCGNCCRNMRGRTAGIPHHMPSFVYMAIPPSQKTIGLFEWEISVLKKKANQLSLNLKAKSDFMFWDEVSKVPIVTQWNIDHDNCPFLSDENRCRVHEQKPLICQAYPLMAFGMLRENKTALKQIGLADCPNAVPLPFVEGKPLKIKPQTLFRELLQLYGSTFLGMLRLDGTAQLLRKSLKYLKKEGLIRPAIVNKNVLKAILRNKPVGLLQHLRHKYPNIERELREGIKSIYKVNVSDLKQIILSR